MLAHVQVTAVLIGCVYTVLAGCQSILKAFFKALFLKMTFDI